MTEAQMPLIEVPALQLAEEPPSPVDMYLVAGWWPQGCYWSIKADNWLERERAERAGREMQKRGWQHVHIVHVHLGE